MFDRDRNTDGDSQYDDTNYSLSYNLRGDMTDDGKDYTMVYDVFGRMCTIKNRGNAAVVQENKYNGLGHRKSFKIDTDLNGDVDGSWGGDVQYPHPPMDERWRMVALFRGTDGKE